MTMMRASARNNGGSTTVGNNQPTHLDHTTQAPSKEPTAQPNKSKPTKILSPPVTTTIRQLYSLHRRHYTTILLLLLYALTRTIMETDASMSDAPASTKRSTSPLAKKNQKNATQGTPPIKQISFLEVPTDEDGVSTTANHNIAT
jgi:hypothetical protein